MHLIVSEIEWLNWINQLKWSKLVKISDKRNDFSNKLDLFYEIIYINNKNLHSWKFFTIKTKMTGFSYCYGHIREH